MFQDKNILITGGTGSWAYELVIQLLKFNLKEIRIYSRNEFAQVIMQRKFSDKRLKFIIGDIRDYEQLEFASKEVDILWHLAALKHVPLGEEFINEFVKTNIEGTKNIIKAAITCKVKNVIDVSSDKAANPISVYGMTKAIGERLIIQANKLASTKFVCVRGGNALGSNGSVVPYFIEQIKKNNKITITSKEMTRYFLTLEEAIKLLFIAYESNNFGVLFIMKMPSCKILDLAEVLIEKYGNKETEIEEIGIRQGEKIHEVLITEYESINTYEYDNNYYIISRDTLNLPKVNFKEYTSNSQPLMNKDEIKQLLESGGF
jgi:UDP-N-acetylglucosamine 4,6-dehydratase/5-epimerase